MTNHKMPSSSYYVDWPIPKALSIGIFRGPTMALDTTPLSPLFFLWLLGVLSRGLSRRY